MIYQLTWKALPGLRGISCSEFHAAPTTTPDNERGVAVELAAEAERDALLVQTTDGEIIVANVSDKGLEPARRYRVADSPTWAHPAAAGNRILVKDETSLAVWAVE
jgi:hypothetical protein